MKILFLDDSNNRCMRFHANWIGNEIDFASSADAALTLLLKNEKYDYIFLDHDLEIEHYEATTHADKNGFYVASNLRNMTHHHGTTVVVHSLNPSGRKNMISVLQDDFRVIELPFAWEMTHKTFVESYK